MYREFLESVLFHIVALNQTAETLKDADENLTPYVNFVPVFLDTDLCGWLQDEVGGQYSYTPVTQEEREWWDARPRSLGNHPRN